MANVGDVLVTLRADSAGWVQGFDQAINKLTALDTAVASTAGATETIDQALTRVGADVKQASADFKAGVISLDDYQAALAQARAEALAFRNDLSRLSGQQISDLNRVLVQTAPAAEGALTGTSRLGTGFAYLAAQSVGLQSSVARTAAGLAFLAGPEVAIPLLGALALIGLAMDAFKTKEDDADKVVDKLTTSLKNQVEQGFDPLHRALEEAGQVSARFNDLQKQATDSTGATFIRNALAQIPGASFLAGDAIEYFGHQTQNASARATELNNSLLAMLGLQRQEAGETKTAAQILAEGTAAGNDEIDRLEAESFALNHTAEDVLRYRLAHEHVPPALIDDAVASLQHVEALKKQEAELVQFTKEMNIATRAIEQQIAAQGINPPQPLQLSGAVKGDIAQQLQDVGPQIQAEMDAARYTVDVGAEALRAGGRNAIRALIDGMVQGKEDFSKVLEKAILDLVEGSIIKVITVALGIASPSKVAIGWGQQVAAGLAIGMSGASPSVAAAATSVASPSVAFNVHVPPARDPFTMARDGDWQRAFRETARVATDGGFVFGS